MNAALAPATPATSPRFVDNRDGTITDTRLNLVWSKATLCNGENVTYADAEKACAELGEGWRLPTIEELFALVDRTRYEPAIDADAFPDTESDYYWTSTPCAWSSVLAWVVGFYDGLVDYYPRDLASACVRAVRSVPETNDEH